MSNQAYAEGSRLRETSVLVKTAELCRQMWHSRPRLCGQGGHSMESSHGAPVPHSRTLFAAHKNRHSPSPCPSQSPCLTRSQGMSPSDLMRSTG